MKIKSVVVGLGKIGLEYDKNNFSDTYNFYTHSKVLHYEDRFDLLAGVDIDKKKRDLFHQQTGNESFDSILSLKSKYKEIDLFVISTPTNIHLQVIKEILNNYKPLIILCEKPLSHSFTETKKILSLFKNIDTELFINFPRRVETSINQIKNELNKATKIKGTVWYSNGLINNGVHFIDLMIYFFGEIRKIDLTKMNHINNNLNIDFDVDFNIEFNKGNIFFLSWDEKLYSNYKIEILTENKRFIIDKNGFETSFSNVENDLRYSGYKCLSSNEKKIKNNLNLALKLVYDDILRFLDKSKNSSILNNQKMIYDVHNTISKLNEIIHEKTKK